MDNNTQPDSSNTFPTPSPVVSTQKIWLGAFGIYSISRKAVMLNIVPIVELWLINIIISIVFRLFPGTGLKALGSIVSILIGVFITICLLQLYLAGLNAKTMTLNEVIEKTTKLYVKALGVYVLIVLTCLSFLLLIIPGLFIVPRVVLAPYYLIDKKLSAVDAYKASWQATKGHLGKIYGIIGVTLLMILPSITIIGVIATIYLVMMYSAATAILYQFVTKDKEA